MAEADGEREPARGPDSNKEPVGKKKLSVLTGFQPAVKRLLKSKANIVIYRQINLNLSDHCYFGVALLVFCIKT